MKRHDIVRMQAEEPTHDPHKLWAKFLIPCLGAEGVVMNCTYGGQEALVDFGDKGRWWVTTAWLTPVPQVKPMYQIVIRGAGYALTDTVTDDACAAHRRVNALALALSACGVQLPTFVRLWNLQTEGATPATLPVEVVVIATDATESVEVERVPVCRDGDEVLTVLRVAALLGLI